MHRSPTRARVWRWGASAGLVLTAAGIALHVAGDRRFARLAESGRRAAGDVTLARDRGAVAWAPAELGAAESALREAQALFRAAELDWWPLPDADRLDAAFSRAASLARKAAELGETRRSEAEADADAAVEEAQSAVAAVTDLAATIHVGAERHAWLARARTLLDEARVHRDAGDVGTSAARAREALDLAARVRDHAASVAARYADAETVAGWQRLKQDTLDWSRRTGRPAIVVSKADHSLTLILAGRPVKVYHADMGFNWIADKRHAGDGATPEGRYRVVARKANGASVYYKALLLDYPNAEDRARFARARRAGDLPETAAIGGLIEIHGEGGRMRDWTRGCVALTNAEMDELFTHVEIGTPVTIVGSDSHGSIADVAARGRNDGSGR